MNSFCNRCNKETWHDRGNCIDCFKNHYDEDERKLIQLQYQNEDKYQYKKSKK